MRMGELMRVEGDAALRFSAVRLDSMAPVEGARGTLLFCDSETGEVRWRDRSGEACEARLGPHAIRLVEVRR